MNTNHSHEKDVIGHLVGVGLVAFVALVIGLMVAIPYLRPAKKETGLVPSNCPSGKVTIEVRINGKLFQSFERNSLQSFDFKVPAAATVIIRPEKVYY